MKKKKQLLSLAMLATMGTSLVITYPNSVSADQINPIKSTTQTQQKPSISNWSEPIQQIYKARKQNSPNTHISKEARISGFNIIQSSVEADGPTFTNKNTMYIGRAILNNPSNRERTLSTAEFSKTMENSVTNSTTNGFNLGVSTSASFGIPIIGQTSVELSTEYNFSNTAAKTKTEIYTYTAPKQEIVVPAYSSVEVIVQLDKVKVSGNVKLLSHVDGSVSWQYDKNKPYNFRGYPLKYFIQDNALYAPSNIKAHPQKGAYLMGTGNYSAEYGSDFIVTVKDISPISPGSIRPTNAEYTYKVKPQVKKVK
ncbi:ETX/MTX2 family pore-forming toxin [Bacillus toyonensis]|uniref:ETX/MTX2 family pore-forming toxin n=1 Tax=Bacillus toyonensis TaxID=155322 RepID=UPI0015C4F3D8|nr:ETX/MTX2 family pore-forming toxin [Bacillus toyonensis]MED3202427.1 ETX/MTX2 family pore-forming toxin [Bacillus toyonensis]